MCVCVYNHHTLVCMWSQKTTLWGLFSFSTFLRTLVTELRLSCLDCVWLHPLSHLTDPDCFENCHLSQVFRHFLCLLFMSFSHCCLYCFVCFVDWFFFWPVINYFLIIDCFLITTFRLSLYSGEYAVMFIAAQ